MINRLLSKLGGQEYRTMLEEDIKRVQGQLEKNNAYTYKSPYDTRMDKLFGQARSKQEQTLRMQNFTLQALFEIFERYYPK